MHHALTQQQIGKIDLSELMPTPQLVERGHLCRHGITRTLPCKDAETCLGDIGARDFGDFETGKLFIGLRSGGACAGLAGQRLAVVAEERSLRCTGQDEATFVIHHCC